MSPRNQSTKSILFVFNPQITPMPTFAYPQGILDYPQDSKGLCTKNKSFTSFQFVLHINTHVFVRKEMIIISSFLQSKSLASSLLHLGVKKLKMKNGV